MTTKRYIAIAVILLSLIGILIAGYLLIKDGADGGEEEEILWINSLPASDMGYFSYTKDGETVSLRRDANKEWHFSDDESMPVSPSCANNMAAAVSALKAAREITGADETEYGFDEPSLTVTARYSENKKVSLVFGAKNTYNNEIYVKDETTGRVYLTAADVPSAFSLTRLELIDTDDLPLIDASDVISVTVHDADGNISTFADGLGVSDAASIVLSLDFDPKGAAAASGKDKEQYGIASDGAYAELTYKTTATVSNSDGTTSTVEATDIYTVYFGDRVETEDGVFYRYTVRDSELVYLVRESTYELLMRYAGYTPGDTDPKGEIM